MTRRVTFTFDNGPTPGVTAGVLDILARRGLQATFFVIGQKLRAPAAAALASEAHAAGHWIGNHTFTHSVALGERTDAAYAAHEIEDTQALIGTLAHPDKLFRPYGKSGRIGPHLLSRAAVSLLQAQRYSCILWSSVPRDWCDPDGWVDRCIADVTARDWTVVVLHDVVGACLPHLSELLDRLDDLGVEYRQDFPEDVVLMRTGTPVHLSDAYMSESDLPDVAPADC
ncbi:MAG: polysaccharide deacetylase family protein [Rhodoplanes sp.]|uniref:polysaccharide deacetylase family protein n=1 Tax=Rhodoplanes sp. TaxID=1968906 RepID=UPI001793B3EB|nr:polysaccharide deacetylase family protein [Rhodoplanes sp.]NVO12473.1 polysaccharide deacetylase family protein [Rhodoplanes sp.]